MSEPTMIVTGLIIFLGLLLIGTLVIFRNKGGGTDGPLGAFLGNDWGSVIGGPFIAPANDAGDRVVRVDPMNTIQLTRAEFDALPEHRLPPKPPTVGVRWKRLYGGRWFVAEYVQAAPGVIGIEIWNVVLQGEVS